jgi:Fe-S-cluster containining protein
MIPDVVNKKVVNKLSQGVGKVRRFANSKVRKTYVEKQLAKRKGECKRCGACCKLLFKCPLLKEMPDGSTECKIHHKRPGNCKLFPLDSKDIEERNHLLPDLPCGYYFEEEE